MIALPALSWSLLLVDRTQWNSLCSSALHFCENTDDSTRRTSAHQHMTPFSCLKNLENIRCRCSTSHLQNCIYILPTDFWVAKNLVRFLQFRHLDHAPTISKEQIRCRSCQCTKSLKKECKQLPRSRPGDYIKFTSFHWSEIHFRRLDHIPACIPTV